MQAYNPSLQVLMALKAIYGLKDAPRAWHIKLDIELRACGGFPLHVDAAVYVWHKDYELNDLVNTC